MAHSRKIQILICASKFLAANKNNIKTLVCFRLVTVAIVCPIQEYCKGCTFRSDEVIYIFPPTSDMTTRPSFSCEFSFYCTFFSIYGSFILTSLCLFLYLLRQGKYNFSAIIIQQIQNCNQGSRVWNGMDYWIRTVK